MKTKVECVRIIDNVKENFDPSVKNRWLVDYFSNRASFGWVTKSFSSRDAARRFRRSLRNKETN